MSKTSAIRGPTRTEHRLVTVKSTTFDSTRVRAKDQYDIYHLVAAPKSEPLPSFGRFVIIAEGERKPWEASFARKEMAMWISYPCPAAGKQDEYYNEQTKLFRQINNYYTGKKQTPGAPKIDSVSSKRIPIVRVTLSDKPCVSLT